MVLGKENTEKYLRNEVGVMRHYRIRKYSIAWFAKGIVMFAALIAFLMLMGLTGCPECGGIICHC